MDHKTCEYWYDQYMHFPYLYDFNNEVEQMEAVNEILCEWRTSPGRWRLGKMEAAVKTIQEAWGIWKMNRCQVCRYDRARYIDKYESAVCESCLNEPEMCKKCGIRESTCPRNLCVKCAF